MQRFFLFFFLVLLAACGSTLELYQWQRVALTNLNTVTGQELASGDTLPLSEYGIYVALDPQSLGSINSSNWITAGSTNQSSELLYKIKVASTVGINSQIAADSIINEYFEGEIEGIATRLSMDDLAKRLGEAGDRIDAGFMLYPKPELPLEIMSQKFSVSLYTQRGSILTASTLTVVFR
jgi:hypothetical protein